jgi:hypothetical protein
MLKAGRLIAGVAVAAALGASAAQAQTLGPNGAAGNDLITLNAYGGGFSPTSSLTPGADFRNSGTVGGAVTLWLHRNVGVRGNVLFARTDVSPGAPEPLANEAPNIWAYSGDLVLRLPLSAGNRRDTLFPYVVGGLGAKTYDFDRNGTETDFAGSFGGGLEYRFARWGIQAEVRDVVSKFDRFGADRVQHDFVWTGGITLSF